MAKNTRMLVTACAAGALLVAPAGSAAHGGKGEGKRCAKTHSVGYSVRGTLISLTADNPATPAHEGTVTIKVTGANSHARNSGEIADQDAATPGVQVAGATYTVPATDVFVLRLHGYQASDTPSVGDAVHVWGRIARTKAKCAPAGTSTADRYAAPDVRRVTIADRDPDA